MRLSLNYEGFERFLKSETYLCGCGGVQYIFKFENDYGASIIKLRGSYGYEKDLWELAVIKFEEDGKWHLNYETPITEDVEGNLTDEDVRDLLKRIKEL